MSEVQVNLPTLAKKFRLHRTPPWALTCIKGKATHLIFHEGGPVSKLGFN